MREKLDVSIFIGVERDRVGNKSLASPPLHSALPTIDKIARFWKAGKRKFRKMVFERF